MNKYRPCIIDLEASGFGSHSYPIEVGVVDNKGDTYCNLIAPPESWTHWDSEAESIHKITPQQLKRHGHSVYEIASILNDILREKTVHSDAWVVDKPWVIKLFHKAKITPQFSISPIEAILTEQQLELWDETKIEVIKDLKLKRHRASTDARIIQETYMRTRYRGQRKAS